MAGSPDFTDPVHGIPVFSLYGTVRQPTPAMMESLDVLLVDLQDLGGRVYTVITTLRYVLEAAARHRNPVWALDRPNPAGRPVEGLRPRPGWARFRGAGARAAGDGAPRAAMAAGLRGARTLVRADFPQARGRAVRRLADSCRGSAVSPRYVPSVAPDCGGIQGAAQPAARLPAMARVCLRIRARPPRDRPHQRRRAAAPLGRRPGERAAPPRSACPPRRGRLAPRPRSRAALP